jgi:hypothetical protein
MSQESVRYILSESQLQELVDYFESNIVKNKNIETLMEQISKQYTIFEELTEPQTVDFIPYERQWYLETGNWKEYRNQVLIKQFHIQDVSLFLDTICRIDGIIAGGFALECLNPNPTSLYDGDIDIYVPTTSKFQSLQDFLTKDCGYQLCDKNVRKQTDTESYDPKHKLSSNLIHIYENINKIKDVLTYEKQGKYIQIIQLKSKHAVSHVRTFDLSGCQTYMTRDQLKTRHMYKDMTKQRVMQILNPAKDQDKFISRLIKYGNRGYKFVSDDEQYLNIQNVYQSKRSRRCFEQEEKEEEIKNKKLKL